MHRRDTLLGWAGIVLAGSALFLALEALLFFIELRQLGFLPSSMGAETAASGYRCAGQIIFAAAFVLSAWAFNAPARDRARRLASAGTILACALVVELVGRLAFVPATSAFGSADLAAGRGLDCAAIAASVAAAIQASRAFAGRTEIRSRRLAQAVALFGVGFLGSVVSELMFLGPSARWWRPAGSCLLTAAAVVAALAFLGRQRARDGRLSLAAALLATGYGTSAIAPLLVVGVPGLAASASLLAIFWLRTIGQLGFMAGSICAALAFLVSRKAPVAVRSELDGGQEGVRDIRVRSAVSVAVAISLMAIASGAGLAASGALTARPPFLVLFRGLHHESAPHATTEIITIGGSGQESGRVGARGRR